MNTTSENDGKERIHEKLEREDEHQRSLEKLRGSVRGEREKEKKE